MTTLPALAWFIAIRRLIEQRVRYSFAACETAASNAGSGNLIGTRLLFRGSKSRDLLAAKPTRMLANCDNTAREHQRADDPYQQRSVGFVGHDCQCPKMRMPAARPVPSGAAIVRRPPCSY
jgi:hypothetical protein